MHKPFQFEVVHFNLDARVWLYQGANVYSTSLQGYGHCCRMSENQSSDPLRAEEGDSAKQKSLL